MPASATDPSHRTFPRFEVLGELGRGGMGAVHRVRLPATGEVFALKELLPDADALDRERFDEEVRALTTVQHEGIVRAHDVVRHGDRSYYTMELVEGLPADAVLESVLGEKLPDRAAIAWLMMVLARLLDAVAALHEARFVHRDLKESNVLVVPSGGGPADDATTPALAARLFADPDPHVKLVDFGLVLHLDRDRARLEAEAGTALTMAPERADPRAPLDPRSDIYSLGVLAYRMLTRRFPFETLAQAFAAHRPDPPPVHELNPACPRPLSELVSAQLAREPHRRCRSAAELRRAIVDALGLGARFPPRLHEPCFCGREAALSKIAEALRRARAEAAQCVWVGGPPGAGATWLLERSGLLARATLDAEFACYSGRYTSGGTLHEGLRRALSTLLLDLADAATLAELVEALGRGGPLLLESLELQALVERHSPGLAAALPELAEPPAPAVRHDLVVESAVGLLALATARGPVLLALDQIERADELDLEILARAAAALGDRPLVLLVAGRDDLPAPAARARAQLVESLGSERTIELALDGLSDSDVRRMLDAMLEAPARADERLLADVLEETNGLPGRIDALLREYWSAGRLEHDGDRWRLREPDAAAGADTGFGPDSGLLDALRGGDRAALEAAAAIGDSFDPGLLARLLDEPPPDELAAILRRLVGTGLVASSPSGWRFVAPSARHAVAERTAPERRRELHRRLASALLDAEGGSPPGERCLAAARHLRLAGAPADAATCYERFARHAEARGAHRRSLECYALAIELTVDADARSRLLEAKGRLHGQIGEFDSALACLREAESGRRDARDLLPLLEERGRIHERRGEFDAAREVLERCRDSASGDPEWEPRVLHRLGVLEFHRGDTAASLDHFQRSLAGFRARGDDFGIASVLLGHGILEKRNGELEEALAHMERAIEHARRAGKRGFEATVLYNLATLHRLRGDGNAAIACFHRSLEINEQLGDRRGVAVGLNNLSRAHGQAGDLRRALDAAGRALDLFQKVGDRRGVLIASSNLASFTYYRGRLLDARALVEANLREASAAGYRQAIADAHASLGRIDAALGEPAEAERHLREALRALSGPVDADMRASCCAELAVAHLALGKREAAEDALREGWSHARDVEGPQVPGLLHHASSVYHLYYEDLDAALEASEQAVALLDAAGWKYDTSLAHRQLACVYRDMGPDWVDRAEDHFRVARRGFEEMESVFELGRTLAEEARLWELLEELEEAADRLEQAVSSFEAAGAERFAARARHSLEELDV